MITITGFDDNMMTDWIINQSDYILQTAFDQITVDTVLSIYCIEVKNIAHCESICNLV